MAVELFADRTTSVPMIQELDLLNYNPGYLSVIYNLQKKGEDRRRVHQLSYKGHTSFIAEHVPDMDVRHWFGQSLASFVMYERRPWFVTNGDTDIMAKVQFSGEDLEALQGREIAIYFFEPLFQRRHSMQRCPAFYDDHSEDVFFPELHWLEDFNRNHGGNLKIVAYVCDYGLGDFLRRRGKHLGLRVETLDIFLLQNLNSKERRARFQPAPNFEISKKFICPNFRYEGYRELVVSYLEGQGHTEQGHISFFHQHDFNVLRDELPFEPTALKSWSVVKAGIDRLQGKLPLTIDSENSRAVAHDGHMLPDWDKVSNIRKDAHLETATGDAFLSIVNESRFGVRCGEISEKIFHPMFSRRPFIVVGAPYTLQYLRELGFKTFNSFWDESYDEIEDHRQRMDAILNLLQSILQRPIADLQKSLTMMESQLRHNHNHLTRDMRTLIHRRIWTEAEQSYL